MPEEPLLLLNTITDIHAEAVHHIEVFGDNARVVYYTRKLAEDGVTWRHVAVDWAIVMPLKSLPHGVEQRYRIVRYGPLIEGNLLRVH